MTRIVIKELIFDEWNIEHIKKHNIEVLETIRAGKNIIYHKRAREGRYLAIGRSNTRLIALVLKRKATKRYYLVTARDASKKERRKVYAKEKK